MSEKVRKFIFINLNGNIRYFLYAENQNIPSTWIDVNKLLEITTIVHKSSSTVSTRRWLMYAGTKKMRPQRSKTLKWLNQCRDDADKANNTGCVTSKTVWRQLNMILSMKIHGTKLNFLKRQIRKWFLNQHLK